jgi:hypothetical protein
MKRISIVIAMVLALLVSTYSQTPRSKAPGSSAPQLQKDQGDWFTPTMRKELMELVKSRSGEAAVRAWARRHKLEIVRLKGYDILVIPEQAAVEKTGGACDATKCPTAYGSYPVHNTLGQAVGTQAITCQAKNCTWIWNDEKKGWNRICGDWQCKNVGSVF